MTEAQIKAIAKCSAKEAVHEVFEHFGFDTNDPIEIQADMQSIRSFRMAQRTAKKATIGTVVTVLITGILALIWTSLIKGGG